jgi:acyl-CoA thioesterase
VGKSVLTGEKEEKAMQKIRQFFSKEDLFARHVGIELVDVGPGWAKTRMKIEPFHLNGAKTVHGGALFTLADFAFAVASNSHGTLAMGINTSMNFVKAALKGTLFAEAEEQSLNRKLASYTVTITDDAGDVVAIFQGMVYRKNSPTIPLEYREK